MLDGELCNLRLQTNRMSAIVMKKKKSIMITDGYSATQITVHLPNVYKRPQHVLRIHSTIAFYDLRKLYRVEKFNAENNAMFQKILYCKLEKTVQEFVEKLKY